MALVVDLHEHASACAVCGEDAGSHIIAVQVDAGYQTEGTLHVWSIIAGEDGRNGAVPEAVVTPLSHLGRGSVVQILRSCELCGEMWAEVFRFHKGVVYHGRYALDERHATMPELWRD